VAVHSSSRESQCERAAATMHAYFQLRPAHLDVVEGMAGNEFGCFVAKMEASAPESFHIDRHLVEKRFEFARAIRLTGD
jgi:hypothetical protein